MKKFSLLFALALVFSNVSFANEHEAAAHTDGEEHKPRHGADLNLLPAPVPNEAKTTRPSAAELVSPAPLAKIAGTAATLTWKEAKGADSYMLQIATDANFKWLVANELSLKTTTYEVKNLEAGKQYFWRVYSLKSDNDPSYLKGDSSRSMFFVK